MKFKKILKVTSHNNFKTFVLAKALYNSTKRAKRYISYIFNYEKRRETEEKKVVEDEGKTGEVAKRKETSAGKDKKKERETGASKYAEGEGEKGRGATTGGGESARKTSSAAGEGTSEAFAQEETDTESDNVSPIRVVPVTCSLDSKLHLKA